jgi:hypothetical protein
LYVGIPPEDGDDFGPYQTLLVVNTALDPVDPAFIVSQGAGAGGSAAASEGVLYSHGEGGLYAFAPGVVAPGPGGIAPGNPVEDDEHL